MAVAPRPPSVARPSEARCPSVGESSVISPSEVRPPRRRPSRNSWIRPSLTNARPSPVRQKSVGKPVCSPYKARVRPCAARPSQARGKSTHRAPPPISECRKMSASDECPPVCRRSDVRCLSVARPYKARVRPRTQKERRANTRQTPPRRGTHPSEARTQSAPAANLKRTPPVQRPCAVPNLSLARTSQARGLSAMRP